jgi:hypothetical protein
MSFRWLWLLLVLGAGCSEYKIESTTEEPEGADEAPESETLPPIYTDEDTGPNELPPDDGVDEDPPGDDPPGDDPPGDDPPGDDPPDEEDDPCSEVVTAFDIEEISSLQDAVSPHLASLHPLGIYNPWYRDALILDYIVPEAGEGESWRISAVNVLITVAAVRFDMHPDGLPLTVEVFDSSDPRVVPGWSVTKLVNLDELTWSDYVLPADAAISGTFLEHNQKGAWMRFDMTDIIPETGMSSSQFVVGVQWDMLSQVAIGYSNFNRACDRNWTEWDPGSGWQLNGDASTSDHCSWPMLQVELEHTYTEDCR